MSERKLLAGRHPDSLVENCVMELAALELLQEAGVVDEAVLLEHKTDNPPCVAPWVARYAQVLNDTPDDEQRQRLLLVKDRIKYEARMPTDPVKVKRVAVRFAVAAARSVEHLWPESAREACEAALETAERWLVGEATEEECAAFASAAAYATTFTYAAYHAAKAAADAAYAAYAAKAAVSATYAAYHAAKAATNATVDVLLDDAITWHVEALAEEGLVALEDEFVEWAERINA